MQSLHVPCSRLSEIRHPASTTSRSESKPTTWPTLSSACEECTVKWMKEESRDQCRDSRTQLRWGQRIPGLCPWGHTDLRDSMQTSLPCFKGLYTTVSFSSCSECQLQTILNLLSGLSFIHRSSSDGFRRPIYRPLGFWIRARPSCVCRKWSVLFLDRRPQVS